MRSIFIDTTKALGILLVVLGHIMSYYGVFDSFKQTFIMFHVPCFFFISGMFYSGNKGVLLYLKKRVKGLVIPNLFFFFTFSVFLPFFLYYLFSFKVINYNEENILSLIKPIFSESLHPCTQIWFLICLFEVSLLFLLLERISYYIFKRENNRYIFLFVLCFILSCLGILLSTTYNLPYFWDNSLTVIIYFCIGYLLKKFNYIYFVDNLSKKQLILFFIVSMFSVYILKNPGCGYFSNGFPGNKFSVIYCGIIGSISLCFAGKLLERIKGLRYIGTNTLIILGTHSFIYQIINIWIHFNNNYCSIISSFLISCLLFIPISYLFNKFFPLCVGR